MAKEYKYISELYNRIWIWGKSKLLERYLPALSERLVISGIIDKDEKKHGSYCLQGEIKYNCVSEKELKSGDFVIIALENELYINEVRKYLNDNNISGEHIYNIVENMFLNDSMGKKNSIKLVSEEDRKIVKFIDVTVPINVCNLRCSYCFIMQNQEFNKKKVKFHSPEYVRRALSKERLGGCAFINFCGNGETLLCEDLIPIVEELIKEGHYVQIVTNATISSSINKILKSGIDFSHLFMKCSFQYLELKRLKLLDSYIENVKKMHEAGISISVEITPEDELIKYIDEIKEVSMNNFGALPHISTAWDRVHGFKLLSKYSIEEYKEIWSSFNSPMFDFKITNFGKKVNYYCHAGQWTYNLNLGTGDLFQCVYHKAIDNIYSDISKPLNQEPIGENCSLPYCYNNHGYLAWGDMPDFETPTYFEMRNRRMNNGKNWVYPEMENIMSQKLYNNI